MQMENYSGIVISSMEDEHDDHEMELPPGFRFHPTDEELITHYLSQKYLDNNFNAVAIGEADLNKIEPWELPKKAKWGEKEWYFFCLRDRKYPSGVRANRATEAGYWKATGKDKEIYKNKKGNGKILVGMKKTLVFYTGRAPKGQKSNWVMHEYRLDKQPHPNFAKNEWVISRVFEKNSGTKKLNDSGSMSMSMSPAADVEDSLPPLTDSSSPKLACHANSSSHIMTCFSNNPLIMVEEDQLNPTTKTEEHDDEFDASSYYSTKSSSSLANMFIDDETPDFEVFDSIFAQDQPMMKLLLDGKASTIIKEELSEDEIRLKYNNGGGEMKNNYSMNSGSNGLDCLWGY